MRKREKEKSKTENQIKIFSNEEFREELYSEFVIPITLPQVLRLAANLKEKNEKLIPKTENYFNTPALIQKIKEIKSLNKANEIRELYQNA